MASLISGQSRSTISRSPTVRGNQRHVNVAGRKCCHSHSIRVSNLIAADTKQSDCSGCVRVGGRRCLIAESHWGDHLVPDSYRGPPLSQLHSIHSEPTLRVESQRMRMRLHLVDRIMSTDQWNGPSTPHDIWWTNLLFETPILAEAHLGCLALFCAAYSVGWTNTPSSGNRSRDGRLNPEVGSPWATGARKLRMPVAYDCCPRIGTAGDSRDAQCSNCSGLNLARGTGPPESRGHQCYGCRHCCFEIYALLAGRD